MTQKNRAPAEARLPRVVGISGNITRPSRTRLVVERFLSHLESSGRYRTEVFDIVDAGPSLGTTVRRDAAATEVSRIWEAIETCDALIVGSPTYKASYSGMLKHLFDLIDKDALQGRPVVMVATGRLPEFSLVVDTQMRPLFGFFRALALPNGLYASDADFVGSTDITSAFADRIADSVARFRAVFDAVYSSRTRS